MLLLYLDRFRIATESPIKRLTATTSMTAPITANTMTAHSGSACPVASSSIEVGQSGNSVITELYSQLTITYSRRYLVGVKSSNSEICTIINTSCALEKVCTSIVGVNIIIMCRLQVNNIQNLTFITFDMDPGRSVHNIHTVDRKHCIAGQALHYIQIAIESVRKTINCGKPFSFVQLAFIPMGLKKFVSHSQTPSELQ